MSDFDVQESIPEKVRMAMERHPILKNMFHGNNFMGRYLYYEANTYDNGEPWHLVIIETEDGIIQFGVEEIQHKEQVDLFYFQPISISELKFYCELSRNFKQELLYLVENIKEEEGIHDHYHQHHHHHAKLGHL